MKNLPTNLTCTPCTNRHLLTAVICCRKIGQNLLYIYAANVLGGTAGKEYRKAGALALDALDLDEAAVGGHDISTNCQP